MCPINFISEAVIHRKPEVDAYKIPFADLKMNLDHFRVQLTHSQINCLLLLVDSINRMQAAVPYRKWRPRNSIKGNFVLIILLCSIFILDLKTDRESHILVEIYVHCRG